MTCRAFRRQSLHVADNAHARCRAFRRQSLQKCACPTDNTCKVRLRERKTRERERERGSRDREHADAACSQHEDRNKHAAEHTQEDHGGRCLGDRNMLQKQRENEAVPLRDTAAAEGRKRPRHGKWQDTPHGKAYWERAFVKTCFACTAWPLSRPASLEKARGLHETPKKGRGTPLGHFGE